MIPLRVVLFFFAAAGEPTTRINVAVKACLPLVEAQASQLQRAHDLGLDAIRGAEADRRESEIQRLREGHERQIADLKEEHARETTRLMGSFADCTSALLDADDDYLAHRLDGHGNNDLYIKRIDVCDNIALVRFQIRQLLEGKPFRLRKVTMRDQTQEHLGALTSTWSETGVLDGVAIFRFPSDIPESVSVAFRGADAITFESVSLTP